MAQPSSSKRSRTDSEETECSVCFEPFADNGTSIRRREVFPCASMHTFCASCSCKINVCPLCREGRDGSTQDERIEQQERERSMDRSFVAVSQTHFAHIAFPRGRDRRRSTVVLSLPENMEHPFDSTNFTVFSLPSTQSSSVVELIRQLMTQTHGARSRRPPRTP